MKKVLLLFLGLMMILSMGSVYAFNYAEKIEYKNNTYFIKDAYNKEIFNMRLVKNTKECLVNCEAEIKINSKDNYKTEQILKLLKINKDLKKFKKFNIEVKEDAIKIKAKKKLKVIVLNTSERGEQRIKILNNFDWKLSLLDKELHKWAWWNSSWSYRQPINISNTAGDLTNYQVRLDLNSSNVGSHFNWSNNGSDIRFTNSTDNELYFWIESWNSTGQEATIWVNATSLPNNQNTTIYMYYGNSEASSVSNGTATFEQFWDCDTDPFTTSRTGDGITHEISSTTYFEGNGSVYMTAQDSSLMELDWTDISGDKKVILWLRKPSGDSGKTNINLGNGGTFEVEAGPYFHLDTNGDLIAFDGTSSNTISNAFQLDTWQRWEIIVHTNSKTWDLYINGENKVSDYDYYDSSISSIATLETGNPSGTATDQVAHEYYDAISIAKYADPEPTVSFGSEEGDTDPPTFSNWQQNPPDLNSSSVGKLYINVTITDDSGVNDSSVKFYHWINDSQYPNQPWCFINGTAWDFECEHNMTNITSSIFNITLHTYAYNPSTHNVHPETMSSATKYNHSLSSNNKALKVRFYNISTHPNTTYILKSKLYRNSGDLLVYYCNSSYTSGKVYNSDYCIAITTLTSQEGTTYQNIHFYGDENSNIDGVKITSTGYIVFYALTGSDWNVEYANIDSNSAETTNNGGTGWTNQDFTPDVWIIQLNGNGLTTFGYKVYACDTLGNCGNSSIQEDSYAIANLPPSPAPEIIVPENSTYSGTFNITWIASKDPNGDPFNYSLYLYYSNGTLADVLADNNITEGTEYFTFDSTQYPDGQYYLISNATDDAGNTNIYIMPYYFTIRQPSISINKRYFIYPIRSFVYC